MHHELSISKILAQPVHIPTFRWCPPPSSGKSPYKLKTVVNTVCFIMH